MWYTRWLHCYSETPWQTRERGRQKPLEAHQRERQSPASQQELPQEPLNNGGQWAGSSFAAKGLGVPVNYLTTSQQHTFTAKKASSILVVWARVLPADQEGWSFPAPQCWWGLIRSPKAFLTIRPLHWKLCVTDTQDSWGFKASLEIAYSSPTAPSRVT